jgi:NAD-dependent dihydropyrimidine dehydrogenase PreA subunit
MIRKIVRIDEDKCNGCGLCVPSCAEGAITIVNGKARLAADNLCDGLGACLGDCPRDAITIIERDSEQFDEAAVEDHLKKIGRVEPRPSQLRQWPVQLNLVSTTASYFQDADLLIAADCVPFACGDFHRDFLAGKALVIGCPKLDDNRFYQEKLTELLTLSTVRSVTVLRMEVPCCGGIVLAAKQALAASGKNIPFTEVVIRLNGMVK